MLLDGASMPDESQLPDDIAGLARRNAHDVSFAHFHADLDSFVRVLQRLLAGPTGVASTGPSSNTQLPKVPKPLSLAREMPFTLSLETLGGVATPLISRETPLPAEASEIFSTATDDQSSVEVKLFAGERLSSGDNVAVGKFGLAEIPAAPKGKPQIKIKAVVDTSLILTVTAEDLGSHRKEILDAVDLTRIVLPPEAKKEKLEAFKAKPSVRDSLPNAGTPDFATLFGDLFGKPNMKPVVPDAEPYGEITIAASEAVQGTEREIKLADGSKLLVRIPRGVQSGSVLRLRGKGPTPKEDGSPGDLLIRVRVSL